MAASLAKMREPAVAPISRLHVSQPHKYWLKRKSAAAPQSVPWLRCILQHLEISNRLHLCAFRTGIILTHSNDTVDTADTHETIYFDGMVALIGAAGEE